ncbi:hypothetical protein DBR06_SOUSAS9810156, partial [Sousa chinensis]
KFPAAQPEVADWSEGVQVPSVPVQRFPAAQATEWVGTATERS